MADRRALIGESSDLSDTSNNAPALPSLSFTSHSHSLGFTSHPSVSPPSSPPKSRLGYSRLLSDNSVLDRNTQETLREEEEDNISDTFGRKESGLGIASPGSPPTQSKRVSIQTIPRVPIGAKSSPIKSPSIGSPPGTGDPLFGGFPRDSSAGSTPDLRRERFSPRDEVGDYEAFKRGVLKKNTRSSEGSLRGGADYQQYLHSPDTERLRKGGAPSIRSAYENDFRPTEECPTARDFYQSRFSWLSVTVIIICLFSTVFSGIFLGIAWMGPRWGRTITTHSSLTPSDAVVLTSIMAKLIELSFVTSFVAFLGQVLSRRAFMKEQGRGITLAEMSMWRWVVQPGTLITHWETAKYAGVTVLGILSLLSAVLATLYAPAASALVQPQLKFGKWEKRILSGQVKTAFANIEYVKKICQTPIRTDEQYAGSTCLQIEHAGQGYYNYYHYLAYWNTVANNGNGTTDQKSRPPGFGLLHENTTVDAKWINVINTKEVSKKHGRAINNVSLAMPHSGVFQAARDQRNGILQPEELDSMGIYSIRASVPSLVMHVLCANMKKEELVPIIYDEWNDELVNITTWPTLSANATTKNKTVVDDLFGWTKKDDEKLTDFPPVFARYPKPFNTIMNHTSKQWGRDSIYLLGQGGEDKLSNHTGQYMLCQIKVSLTPHCSTRYNATGGGGTMEALCEEDHDESAYIRSNSSATQDQTIPDWRDIGFDWANSMSLNTGIMDADASNSRLLTQLILPEEKNAEGEIEVDLNPALPSPGEALAVMSGCTLLMSALDTPFVDFWNYTTPALGTTQTQYFNASILAQQYASGGTDKASRGFILILVLVFVMNIFVLVYFLFHRGLVTDFSEPPNLFTLAVNSPPSHLLAGSCGGGPEGEQYIVNWFVNTEGDHLYMEPGAKPVNHVYTHAHTHSHGPAQQKTGVLGKVFTGINELRERGLGFGQRDKPLLRPASVVQTDFELEDANTRTQRQYLKLAKRRSML
ncbi:hypothetical protein K469DRAFT_721788 [Zopfia rhizophila CBS 207.26]|uniref:Uncharacterized protein n=1 Tax=Zopfia rhizophila CBS 207.26 TaxID=1314779 RepID=A0A6A6EJF1_9PEZI|nr:hypothetical protein K469DRAFT_721788 [Zopfia rhizophila CBS 207.26]